MCPVLGETLLPGLGTLTWNFLVRLLDKYHSKIQTRLEEKPRSLQSDQSTSFRTNWRVPAVYAGPAARASAVVVAIRGPIPKKTRNLQFSSKNNWYVDHSAEQCSKALGDKCSVAWAILLDTLHRSAQAGRNTNKHAVITIR